MNLSPELLLTGAILALYLYDCAVLLHWNEVLLASPARGRWWPVFGSRTLTFRGRELALGAALLPGLPVFRLQWSPETPSPEARPSTEGAWRRYAEDLRPLQWCSLGVFLATVVALPTALLLRAGDGALLVLVALVYASIACALLVVWTRRKRLDVDSRAFLKLAFEALACPPMAANLPSRLSLRSVVDEDFACLAPGLLAGRRLSASLAAMRARIRDEMESEEEGSDRHARLRSREAQLR